MAVALETFVKHLTDSGVIAPGKLENFIPPKATPKDAQELARQLVQSKHLTKYQAQEIYQGRAKSLILGNYTILDKIGAGGMGQVFKAEHRRMKRVVAIKVLPRSVTKDAAAAARFQREVEAAAKLEHPNIVTAHDADEADGIHFLVMQCVDGQDLSVLVKKNGPFSVSKAVNYILQAARGLEYAHKNGVIHRDIKPGNLLLNAEGTVKILDMGLARIDAGGDAATQAELTGTGAVMGTVDYMAPEQALSTKHADARADIYSLGCTLFYLLTSKPIYDGETLTAKLIGHQTQPIPDLRKVCSQAPAELATVFQRMVAKKVEDRYQTMSEVVAALESCLVALPTGSNPAAAAIRIPDSGNFNPLNKPATTAGAADRTAVHIASTSADVARATALSRRGKLAIGGGLLAVAVTVGLIVLIKAKGPEPVVADQQPPALSQTASPQGVTRTTGVPERAERQFVDLFNGHDLAGWHPVGAPELWQVDATEGVLTATGAGLGWMLNDRDFGDFVLRLEYQHAPDANSGLALLVVYPLDSDFLEVQVGNIPGYATGGLWSNPANHVDGGFLRAARPAQEKPADQWNQLEVELRERRLTVNLNGSEVSRFDLEQLAKEPGAFPPITRATGRIALQSQAGRVRFRKIQLATAPAHEPITTYTTAVFKQWEANVAALSPEDQVDAVRQKLMELNPGFDGKENHQVEGGAVTKIYFDSDQVTDLSPLRALKYLGLLHCSGSGTRAGKLADLSPLQGMKIGHLYCGNTQISDLSPLVGMPLTILSCDRTQIASLKPLEGMKLISFSCWLTPVSDLSPLRGMPLTNLGCFASPVSDLSPLRGMKLTTLNTCWTAVSDLSPLAGMPLTMLWFNGTLVTDLTPLRGMKLTDAKLTPQNIKKGMNYLREMTSLKAIGIGDKPDEQFTPAAFWNKYDAGDFGKPDKAPVGVKSNSVRTVEPTPATDAATANQGKPSIKPGSLAALKEVDLLKLLDPKKHARNGDWTFEAEALVTPKELHFSLLEIPYAPPEAYDLELVAQPISDKTGLVIGLAAGTNRVEVGIDCYDGEISGLALIDGNTAVNNGTAHKGRVLANQSANTILCAVRHNRIVVTCAGKTIIDWHGDFSRLSLFDKWKLEPGRNLFIGSHTSFRISRMVLRPIPTFNDPAFTKWQKDVARLPADRQIDEVVKELTELNPGFDGKVTGWDLSPTPNIVNGVVTSLAFNTDDVTDVSPVRALVGLKRLYCLGTPAAVNHCKLSDLSPLQGMSLASLVFANNPVADLSPLSGMPLTVLDCQGTQVANLSALKGMKLTNLAIQNSQISDLSPLKSMPITVLLCHNTKVSDLSPLEGMPLVQLNCNGTQVFDLSPLKRMSLADLECSGTQVADLSPLKGMPIARLLCNDTPVTDLSALEGMALKEVWFTPKNITKSIDTIRRMTSLTSIAIGWGPNEQFTPAEFWQKYDAGDFKTVNDPAFRQWMKEVAAMPAEQQVEAVVEKLQDLNPKYDGQHEKSILGDAVAGFGFVSCDITDISPIRALTRLRWLHCAPSALGGPRSSLADLSPLKGMGLTELSCYVSSVSDFSPLAGMSLTSLDCGGTLVTDLTPLKGVPLRDFRFTDTNVSDLTPLDGMPLKELHCCNTPVSDLSPLRATPLRTFRR